MANLSRTRTLFAFTSPRTIEKIIPEIQLLIKLFAGYKWSGNSELQEKFYNALAASDFFEKQGQNSDPAFAARDRITRSPQMLGFVDLKPKITLTEAGVDLLSGRRTSEVIAKQLFKFQLPSSYHKIPKDRNFNIKPYLELLRLVNELGNLSKMEIAIYFLQMTNHSKFKTIVAEIKKFRSNISKHKGNRKAFIDKVFTDQIQQIYTEDIKKKNFKTRESKETTLGKFVTTKKSMHVDYADAFMRYLRATGYVSFDKKTFRMIVAPSHTAEVDYVLNAIDRDIKSFKTLDEYKKYLFDPDTLHLLTDNRDYLEKQLSQLKVKFSPKSSIENLKDLLDKTEEKMVSKAVSKTQTALKDYREFDDIIDVFGKILKKEIPDLPLHLEWNIWRSMIMINYANKIVGNFRLDLDGMPLNTALGNLPDIEAEYDGFKMIVEVTMSSGNKQYEMEGEPVARHFGKAQNNSDAPVYCLFVAPKISEGTLAHFFNLNRMKTRAYGGKTRIVPMSLDQFISFITVAKDKGFNNAKVLKTYLDRIIQNNQSADDETVWYHHINDSISGWIA